MTDAFHASDLHERLADVLERHFNRLDEVTEDTRIRPAAETRKAALRAADAVLKLLKDDPATQQGIVGQWLRQEDAGKAMQAEMRSLCERVERIETALYGKAVDG